MKLVASLLMQTLLMTSICFAVGTKIGVRDLDRDGVPEKTIAKEYTGGKNMWLDVKVVRKGKVILRVNGLCITGDKQGYMLLDADKKRHGVEFIVYEALGQSRDHHPDRFVFHIHGWQRGSCLLYKDLYTIGKYKEGSLAKRELIEGKATPLKCHVAIAGSFSRLAEAKKANQRLQRYIGDAYGYDIDRSDHYIGLRPGYFVLISGFYTKKGALDWIEFAGDRGGVKAYLKRVAKTCPCAIFHSGDLPTGANFQ